jgi:hypothetical protein
MQGAPYGESPSTHPPHFYNERHVFNEGRQAVRVDTPWRKMAQYAFTGSATPVLALPANHLRCYMIIQNLSAATNLFIGFGAGAIATNGLLILPNGGNFLADYSPPTDDIYIFFAAGAAELCVIAEGVYQPPPEY